MFFFLFFLPSKHYVHLFIYFALFIFKTFAFSFRTQKKKIKTKRHSLEDKTLRKRRRKKDGRWRHIMMWGNSMLLLIHVEGCKAINLTVTIMIYLNKVKKKTTFLFSQIVTSSNTLPSIINLSNCEHHFQVKFTT